MNSKGNSRLQRTDTGPAGLFGACGVYRVAKSAGRRVVASDYAFISLAQVGGCVQSRQPGRSSGSCCTLVTSGFILAVNQAMICLAAVRERLKYRRSLAERRRSLRQNGAFHAIVLKTSGHLLAVVITGRTLLPCERCDCRATKSAYASTGAVSHFHDVQGKLDSELPGIGEETEQQQQQHHLLEQQDQDGHSRVNEGGGRGMQGGVATEDSWCVNRNACVCVCVCVCVCMCVCACACACVCRLMVPTFMCAARA